MKRMARIGINRLAYTISILVGMIYKSMFDFDLKGKTVFLRADLNSTVIEGRVVISSRLREHSKTVYALREEGAKVVVLSHQGRPGEQGFIKLRRHADFVKKFIDQPVKFVKWEDDYEKEIKEMKDGEVIVLDNTRFQKEELENKTWEEHSNDSFIKKLGPLGDLFVQDALSVCHRSQASIVGFKKYMPCVTGPVLERELTVIDKLEETKTNGKLLVLGGSKLTDSIGLLSGMLDSGLVNRVCIGGLFGELFLKAQGIDFGEKEKYFKEHGLNELIPQAKELLDKYDGKLVLPVDLAVSHGKKREEIKVSDLPSEFSTMDIGRETTELFKREIRSSSLVVFNGPMGVYENEHFSVGTKKILESIAFHRCFSIVGGGDTEKALMSFGLMPQDFSHTSLAGKALLLLLSGKPLPGLEILEKK